MQKYPHIIVFYKYNYDIFMIFLQVTEFLLHMKFLISFEICSTLKLSKYVTLSPFTYIQSNEFLLFCVHQDLLPMSRILF